MIEPYWNQTMQNPRDEWLTMQTLSRRKLHMLVDVSRSFLWIAIEQQMISLY